MHLEPELAAKVDQWSAETGRPASELIEDAFAGYFGEVEDLRGMLGSRYEDIVSGRVKAIPGEEAIRLLQERAAARDRSGAAGAVEKTEARG